MFASIRQDLYETETLIPAKELATGKDKYLEPILWELVETTDEGKTILKKPVIAGGGLYEFYSIDLDTEQ